LTADPARVGQEPRPIVPSVRQREGSACRGRCAQYKVAAASPCEATYRQPHDDATVRGVDERATTLERSSRPHVNETRRAGYRLWFMPEATIEPDLVHRAALRRPRCYPHASAVCCRCGIRACSDQLRAHDAVTDDVDLDPPPGDGSSQRKDSIASKRDGRDEGDVSRTKARH